MTSSTRARLLSWSLAAAVAGFAGLERGAAAEPATLLAPAQVAPRVGHRLSLGAGVTAVRASRARGGHGGTAQLAYDLFLTRAHAVGLVAAASLDFASFGPDADSMTVREGGLRYSYFHAFSSTARLVPFASAGILAGRTGGELHLFAWVTSLAVELGVQWRAFDRVAFDLTLVERLSRVHGDRHLIRNAAGAMLGMSILFPD